MKKNNLGWRGGFKKRKRVACGDGGGALAASGDNVFSVFPSLTAALPRATQQL